MQEPKNAAAREIERLRGVNRDLDMQISDLSSQRVENAEVIGNLSHVAEWTESGEPDGN